MLQIDLEGLQFEFRIEGYRPSTKEHWDEEWCKVYARATNGSEINYSVDSEVLLCCEVEWLYHKLQELMDGILEEDTEIPFIEPDFEFYLHPNKNSAPDMDWKFNLWNSGVLTSNCISTYWIDEDIEKIKGYLKTVLVAGGYSEVQK